MGCGGIFIMQIGEMRKKLEITKEEREKFLLSISPKNFKSRTVTCKQCKTRLTVNQFKGLDCPICGKSYISDSNVKKLNAYNRKISDLERSIKEAFANMEKKQKEKKTGIPKVATNFRLMQKVIGKGIDSGDSQIEEPEKTTINGKETFQITSAVHYQGVDAALKVCEKYIRMAGLDVKDFIYTYGCDMANSDNIDDWIMATYIYTGDQKYNEEKQKYLNKQSEAHMKWAAKKFELEMMEDDFDDD